MAIAGNRDRGRTGHRRRRRGHAVASERRGRRHPVASRPESGRVASSALGSRIGAHRQAGRARRRGSSARRASKELVLDRPRARPAPYVPPDPDVIGVTRRQFFNRSIVSDVRHSVCPASAPRASPSCGPSSAAASAPPSRSGSVSDLLGPRSARQQRLPLQGRGAHVAHASTPTAPSRRPRPSTPGPSSPV